MDANVKHHMVSAASCPPPLHRTQERGTHFLVVSAMGTDFVVMHAEDELGQAPRSWLSRTCFFPEQCLVRASDFLGLEVIFAIEPKE